MKYVNKKEKNIQYKLRPGSYVIITRKDDNKIGIASNGIDHFYFGGGIEKNETELEALQRELVEELGYTITNIQEFDKVGSFLFAEEHGYLEVIANIYIAYLDKKMTDPIEKDHNLMWINPEDYIGKMCREWQNYILKEYIQRFKNK